MGYRGRKTPAEVAAMFPMIRSRAWSRLNAGASRHGEGTLPGRVEVIRRTRSHAGYFALDSYRLRHERFDGGLGEEVRREVFLASDAALVLPYDPVRDRVLVVEQMRMGPLARGDATLWQLEPIAGRLDPGEDPQSAARREALEEAGLALGTLEPVAEAYCSPGNSSEFYFIYIGIADLPDSAAGTGGLDAEDEDIRSHLIGFDQLMEMCGAMKIANAPLVTAAYWLAHHRARLRRSNAGVE
jgi:nudix-type nucleoside diphosphatase (YffH/AdpP family)